MPHTFRTIEAFVQLLEERKDACLRQVSLQRFDSERGFWSGKADSFKEVLEILRTSNIGIVNPPTEGQS